MAMSSFFFSISAHVSKELEGRDFDSGVDRVKPLAKLRRLRGENLKVIIRNKHLPL